MAPISSYSKGMKQRVLIASALLHDPDLLILDEPLSGLDIASALLLHELIAEMARQGKTILYISHVLDRPLAERVVLDEPLELGNKLGPAAPAPSSASIRSSSATRRRSSSRPTRPARTAPRCRSASAGPRQSASASSSRPAPRRNCPRPGASSASALESSRSSSPGSTGSA